MLIPIFLQRQHCLLSPGSMAGDGKSRKWDEWRYQQILPNSAPILPKEEEQSLQWGCQCEGTRSQTGLREVGFWGFCFFSISSQTFYQKYIQVTLNTKVTHKSSDTFSPKNIYFYTRHSLKKKSLEKSKQNLFFPSSSLSSELKKINYMLILSHRSEKPHWALMELTPFLNFQLGTRSLISVTPACVSSHQEHLHHHSKGKLPPILSCIHQQQLKPA